MADDVYRGDVHTPLDEEQDEEKETDPMKNIRLELQKLASKAKKEECPESEKELRSSS